MAVEHEDIVALVEPLAQSAGYDLEAVRLRSAGRRSQLVVVVDADRVDSDGLAEFSRAVSEALDTADLMGETPYTLEVSSRGVDAPLTLPRHWRRNVGRLVEVTTLSGGAPLTGRIEAADETAATVSGQAVPYEEIERARIQVEFTPAKEGG